MKNAKYVWGNERQRPVPSQDAWGSREWRRYEERQKRKAEQEDEIPTAALAGCLWAVFVLICALVGVFAGPWWCKAICLGWLLTHVHIGGDKS